MYQNKYRLTDLLHVSLLKVTTRYNSLMNRNIEANLKAQLTECITGYDVYFREYGYCMYNANTSGLIIVTEI